MRLIVAALVCLYLGQGTTAKENDPKLPCKERMPVLTDDGGNTHWLNSQELLANAIHCEKRWGRASKFNLLFLETRP